MELIKNDLISPLMWKHPKPMLVNYCAIMLENMMGAPFHLHLSCHRWSICMNLLSKIKHQKATFFMKYKYWILVLSKQLRKSGDWSFYVTYHILFYLMGFVPSIWWLVDTEKWNMCRIPMIPLSEVQCCVFNMKD